MSAVAAFASQSYSANRKIDVIDHDHEIRVALTQDSPDRITTLIHPASRFYESYSNSFYPKM
jgi:hypothetical protein